MSAQISIPPAASASSPLNILLDSGTVRVLSPVHAIFSNAPFLPSAVPCILCILPLNDEILPADAVMNPAAISPDARILNIQFNV